MLSRAKMIHTYRVIKAEQRVELLMDLPASRPDGRDWPAHEIRWYEREIAKATAKRDRLRLWGQRAE